MIISKLMVYLIGGYNNSHHFLVNMMCWPTVDRASISCILARKYQQLPARVTEFGNTLMR